MKKSDQLGFTIIELVVVIVLIGLLAAAALPKFANITSQARDATAQGVAGVLGAAVNISHGQWLSNGETATITLSGTTVVMSSQGWPEATSGAANGTATAAKCLEVWNGIMSDPPHAAAGSCTGTCEYLAQVTTSPTCEYIDKQGNGSNTIRYNITNGVVSVS